jgi:hypothetical protein
LFTIMQVVVYWYASCCLLVRELLFTGTRDIVYWYASCCLLVRELLFTGTRVREILFTGIQALVYGYVSDYLLVRELFTGTQVIVYWYAASINSHSQVKDSISKQASNSHSTCICQYTALLATLGSMYRKSSRCQPVCPILSFLFKYKKCGCYISIFELRLVLR